MRLRPLACLFALLAALHTPLRAQETKFSLEKAVAALPEDSSADAQEKRIKATPAIWVVKDEDTIIYMFGTLHLMKPQIDWFDGPVRAAYASADEIVTELGVVDEAAIAQSLAAVAVNKDGPPVTPELTDVQRVALEKALSAAGMPAATADKFKPWFTAIVLTVAPLKKLGFDSKLGVDSVIRDQAVADGKLVSGLETADEQFALFDGLPRGLQIQLLTTTLDEADQLSERVELMLSQWASGDAEAIAAMLNENTAVSAELSRILLYDRNKRWADWIVARLAKPGTVFMAVGAGHLAGYQSVQEALAMQGVVVERLKAD